MKDANVLAIPGCNTFFPEWVSLFRGKTVNLMFDNDHPVKHSKNGKLVAPAGLSGVCRIAGILADAGITEINYLKWGSGTFTRKKQVLEGFSRDLPHGYDVRDSLAAGEGEKSTERGLAGRIRALGELLGKIEPVPEEWRERPSTASTINAVTCDTYKKLRTSWRKALKWTDGLDHALTTMLASIASTMTLGDQLWFKIIGPAACGKSTLCEALSVSKKYVLAKSTLRGFHSGFSANDSTEDHSLISKLKGMTFITKDGDTLLQSPNLPQILSEGRDIYDGVSRTSYRNAMSKDYEGIRMTWLLCGTSSLRQLDQSELGERFLDCVIMERIDDALEDEILERVVNRAVDTSKIEANCSPETHYEPSLREAMALTGGYVEWLRENVGRIIGTVDVPRRHRRLCGRLGKFVAHMRARPSQRQEGTAEREFGTRLAVQLVRLSQHLAIVLNRKSVDKVVIQRVRQVALDTRRGPTLDIIAYLYDAEKGGSTQRALNLTINGEERKTGELLRFLRAIEVVESFRGENTGRIGGGAMRYRLTKKIIGLYRVAYDLT